MAATTTALEIFKLAIGLMGENNASGEYDTSDNAEYKNRVLQLLNVLIGELYPLSDTYSVTAAGTRPVAAALTDFSTAVSIDDTICRTVMPYGLAAQLLLDENPAMASFFQQRYEELRSKLGTAPAEFSSIESSYGGIEHGQFSRW